MSAVTMQPTDAATTNDPPTVPHYDDLNTRMIGLAGLLGTLLTFIAIVFAQVLYYAFDNSAEQAKAEAIGPTAADDVLRLQREKLAVYGWIDREKGQVAIPIERAMQAVVQELTESVAQEAEPHVR
jgi:hypothetical protein